MLTAQSRIYIKQAATSGVTSLAWIVVAILWDELNWNSFIFPWIVGWSGRTKVEVGICSSIFLLVLGIVAFYNMNIRLRDVTYER